MGKWITNWPHGSGSKWGRCGAAFAAQIVAEGRCQVRLVASDHKLSRIILITPAWAQTMAQKHPAVALALKLSPLDQYRQTVRIPPARTLPQAACA